MAEPNIPKFFACRSSTPWSYSDIFEKNEIVQFVKKLTGPASQEVDCDTMKRLVADSDLAVSYFGAKNGDVYKLFERLVERSRDATKKGIENVYKYDYFSTTDVDCAKDFAVDAPGMFVHRDFE